MQNIWVTTVIGGPEEERGRGDSSHGTSYGAGGTKSGGKYSKFTSSWSQSQHIKQCGMLGYGQGLRPVYLYQGLWYDVCASSANKTTIGSEKKWS